MSWVSEIRPARKNRLTVVVLAQVIAGSAALTSLTTSPLIGLVTAAALVLMFVLMRALIAASRKIDRIFDEELISPVQRHSDGRWDATES